MPRKAEKGTKKEPITISLTGEIAEKLGKLAERNGAYKATLAGHIVSMWVDSEFEKVFGKNGTSGNHQPLRLDEGKENGICEKHLEMVRSVPALPQSTGPHPGGEESHEI